MDYIGGGISNVATKFIEGYKAPWKKIIKTIDKKLLRKENHPKAKINKYLKRNDQNIEDHDNNEDDYDDYNYDEYDYDNYYNGDYYYDDYDEKV